MAINCKTHARNKNWFIKKYQHVPHFLGHIRCFVCDNIGHKAMDWNFTMHLRRYNKREENMQSQPHKKKKDQQMKVWRRKEQQCTPTKN